MVHLELMAVVCLVFNHSYAGMWFVTCEVGVVVQLQQNELSSNKEKQLGRTNLQSSEITVQIGVCRRSAQKGIIRSEFISIGTLHRTLAIR